MENKENNYQCCNRHELLEVRRQLRKSGEAAEAVLWKCIKSRQILGYKFRRQFSIGPYILDFYCPEAKLCVELDGADHYTIDGAKSDQFRSGYLFNEHGIKVLRFENRDLYYNLEGVLNEITHYLRIIKQNKE
jgi:very-short-patch-repair endonuclease